MTHADFCEECVAVEGNNTMYVSQAVQFDSGCDRNTCVSDLKISTNASRYINMFSIFLFLYFCNHYFLKFHQS